MCQTLHYIVTTYRDQVSSSVIHISDILSSNLGPYTGYSELQSPQPNLGKVPQIRAKPLPSSSFPVH